MTMLTAISSHFPDLEVSLFACFILVYVAIKALRVNEGAQPILDVEDPELPAGAFPELPAGGFPEPARVVPAKLSSLCALLATSSSSETSSPDAENRHRDGEGEAPDDAAAARARAIRGNEENARLVIAMAGEEMLRAGASEDSPRVRKAEVGERWRKIAHEEAMLRNAAREKAEEAFREGRTDEGQMWKAKDEEHHKAMNENNAIAVAEIFACYNPRYDPATAEGLAQCDLHFLHISEAVQVAIAHVNACRNFGLTKTMFVTGKGNRSKGGVSRLRPVLSELLNEGDLHALVGVPNVGCITVYIGERR